MKTTHQAEENAMNDDVTAATLKAELMQITLDELHAAPDVWAKCAESQQQEVIDRLDNRVSSAVKQSIELFATSGIARVAATMEQVTVKDGIKAVLSLGRHDTQRLALVDAQGQTVYIVLANPEQFTDAPHEQEPDGDQKELPIQ